MRCERARELFSDHVEGSIQRALQVPLDSHLVECEECRAEVAGLRRVWRMLDEAPLVEPPSSLRAVVWQRIEEQDSARAAASRRPAIPAWRALLRWRTLGWAAAVLVVLALLPVVVPGNYAPAGFGWSPFVHRAPALQVGQPQLSPARDSVRIPLRAAPGKTITATVRIARPGVAVGTTNVEVGPDRATDVVVAASPDTPHERVDVSITWSQEGRTQSKNLTVSLP